MPNSVKKHLVLAVAMTMPGIAFSQALEEVVVTAQKRAQSAQDVPIAITALSGEFLEEWNVLSVTDLQKFTPGLNVPQQDASKTFIHIRGVGSGKFDAGSSGSVGVFIDEIYLPRFSGADIGLLDLARVEVLKGPQGTIFGRNTAAGAISVTTQRPTEETEVFVEAGAGNKDSYLTRGAISGAVADSLSMRLAVGHQEEGGFQKNTLTGNTDDRSTTTGRLSGQFDASDTLTVLSTVQYTKRKQDALLQKNIALGTEDGSIVPVVGSPLLSFTANNDFRDYPISTDGGIDYDTWFASVRIEKDLEGMQLVSISGYQDGDGTVDQDFDGNDANIGISHFKEDYNTFSQEFRLAGDQWLGGIFYYRDDVNADYIFEWLEDSIIDLFQPGVVTNGPMDNVTTSWAAFGQYTFDLTDKLALTLGGRYSEDEIDFTLKGITNAPGVPPVPVPYTYSDKKDWNSFDPKVSFTYQVNDDILTYLTYSEGNKAGGIQFTASNEAIAREIFDPENLSSYELGIKSELLDNTLRLNASAFYYDYQDLQVQIVDLVLSEGLPTAFTTNAGESEIMGFEFDLNWVPVESLDIRFAYAYLDAQYTDFIGPNGEDFSDNTMPLSPKNTVIFSINYTTTLSNNWTVSAGTEWSWKDDFNFDVDEDNPYTEEGDYTLGGARFAVTSPDAHWTVSAFVNNVTDEDYYSQLTRRDTEVIGSAGNGRRYGLRLRYDF